MDPGRSADPSSGMPSRVRSYISKLLLGDLAVEVAFPACGLIRLPDANVNIIETTMTALSRGEVFHGERGWVLTAGSRAESVAMEGIWGHGKVDADVMRLYGGDLAVGMTPMGTILAYRDEWCPPAYTRVEVLNEERLLFAIKRRCLNRNVPDSMVNQCVCGDGTSGRRWLQSYHLLDIMRLPDHNTIQGPAASGAGGLSEFVTGLVCWGPHPGMAAFTQRLRTQWPSPSQLQDLFTMPMLLVCVGPKGHHDAGSLFRISWTPQERRLLNDLALWVKQGYVCFKYVLKSLLSLSKRESGGRSHFGSYHLKTVFLRHLEEHPPQPTGSPFQLVEDLCWDLLRHLVVQRQLPHYFLPTCDLLQALGESERQDAINAAYTVLQDPLAAIIRSPSCPEHTYGSQHRPDHILRCFQAVSQKPTCDATREALQGLLGDLDKHREGQHREQMRRDGYTVSGRPCLVRLADYLQRNAISS